MKPPPWGTLREHGARSPRAVSTAMAGLSMKFVGVVDSTFDTPTRADGIRRLRRVPVFLVVEVDQRRDEERAFRGIAVGVRGAVEDDARVVEEAGDTRPHHGIRSRAEDLTGREAQGAPEGIALRRRILREARGAACSATSVRRRRT